MAHQPPPLLRRGPHKLPLALFLYLPNRPVLSLDSFACILGPATAATTDHFALAELSRVDQLHFMCPTDQLNVISKFRRIEWARVARVRRPRSLILELCEDHHRHHHHRCRCHRAARRRRLAPPLLGSSSLGAPFRRLLWPNLGKCFPAESSAPSLAKPTPLGATIPPIGEFYK